MQLDNARKRTPQNFDFWAILFILPFVSLSKIVVTGCFAFAFIKNKISKFC